MLNCRVISSWAVNNSFQVSTADKVVIIMALKLVFKHNIVYRQEPVKQ